MQSIIFVAAAEWVNYDLVSIHAFSLEQSFEYFIKRVLDLVCEADRGLLATFEKCLADSTQYFIELNKACLLVLREYGWKALIYDSHLAHAVCVN